jgi:4-amino-4-deoxy-L-arabinose transferase-like glycosyltransferase
MTLGVIDPQPRLHRSDLALIAVVGLVVHLLTAGHPPFSSSSRYTLSVIEMARSGDWIVPHLASVPYLEKPILTYWLGALSVLCFGEGDRAVHFPSGLATIVSACCTYILAFWAGGRRVALAAGLGFLGSALVLALGSILTTDALLAACLALSWVGWGSVLRARAAERSQTLGLALFWLGMSLGYLTKGPVAIALCGAAVAGHGLVVGGPRGVWREFLAVRWWYGVLVLLAINLPWTWAIWDRDSRLVTFFYAYINLGAIAGAEVNHPHPPWFYLPIIVAACLPWAVPGVSALIAGGIAGIRSLRRDGNDITGWCTSILLWGFLFLSAVSSKLESYILPLMPAAAVMIVVVWQRWSAAPPRWLRIATSIQGAALALACVVVWFVPRLEAEIAADGWFAASAAIAALGLGQAGMAIFVWLRCGWWRGMAIAGVGFVLCAACLLPNLVTILPDRFTDPLIAVAKANIADEDLVVVTGVCVHDYAISRGLNRRAAILGSARELGLGHFLEVAPSDAPAPGFGNPTIDDPYMVNAGNVPENPWLLSRADFISRWTSAERIWYFCRRGDSKKLSDEGVDVYEVAAGRHTWLLTNHPLPAVEPMPDSPHD